jgi:diacylglycerol kinase family enzyme
MEVAEAAMTRGVPLAIIPRGTANAVAWHFGIPFDAARAFRVALDGRPIRVDVGRAGHRDFIIMAGLGYDAHVIRDATRELKRRLGFLAYLYASVRNMGRRPQNFRLVLDGGKPIHLRGVAAVVANLGTLAGNIRAVRGVSPQDGLLDLLVFSSANLPDFFRMLFLGLMGRLEQDPRVHLFRARRIRVETRPQAPIEIDGEHLPGRHAALEAEVLPGALTILVPPEGMSRLPWVPDLNWSPPAFTLPGLPRSRGAGEGDAADVPR